MDADEKATELVDSMIRYGGVSVNTNNERVRVEIAAAIRAAENDVLERVALYCDERAAKDVERSDRRPDLSDGSSVVAYEEVAAFVRSMKQK